MCRFENTQCFAKTNLGVQDVHGIQPEPLFNNLLATPPCVRNYMESMGHAMALGFTGASFVTMSKGVQV